MVSTGLSEKVFFQGLLEDDGNFFAPAFSACRLLEKASVKSCRQNSISPELFSTAGSFFRHQT